MKKLIAMLMVFALCASVACAAEWPEGLGPQQPYPGVPEVDLTKTMGYIMLYPRVKVPASHFCNTLEIFLPREDIVLNKGTVTLYSEDQKPLQKYAFDDRDHVQLRALEDSELEDLMWGGGCCVSIRLDKSLDMDTGYFVAMDAGCFTAADGKLSSLVIGDPKAWQPLVTGDYGISGLYYSEPEEAPEPTAEPRVEEPSGNGNDEAVIATATPTARPTPVPKPAEIVYKLEPEVGDVVTFDLVLGGEAKSAVIFSENDSVLFENQEIKRSGTVTGTVTKADLSWGVVFLNESGDAVHVIPLN